MALTPREHFARLLAPLHRRIRLAIGLALLKLVDDAYGIQKMQVELLDGEIAGGANHFQPYGYTSVPLAGAQGVSASVGGARSRTVILVMDDRRYRKKGLAAGELALYHHQGDYIHFKNGRIIKVVSGSQVEVEAPELLVSASTKVTLQTPLVDCQDTVKAGQEYQVAGTKVVGSQQAAIPDPAGGGTVDAQARATEVLILNALRTHGLIAS